MEMLTHTWPLLVFIIVVVIYTIVNHMLPDEYYDEDTVETMDQSGEWSRNDSNIND